MHVFGSMEGPHVQSCGKTEFDTFVGWSRALNFSLLFCDSFKAEFASDARSVWELRRISSSTRDLD